MIYFLQNVFFLQQCYYHCFWKYIELYIPTQLEISICHICFWRYSHARQCCPLPFQRILLNKKWYYCLLYMQFIFYWCLQTLAVKHNLLYFLNFLFIIFFRSLLHHILVDCHFTSVFTIASFIPLYWTILQPQHKILIQISLAMWLLYLKAGSPHLCGDSSFFFFFLLF